MSLYAIDWWYTGYRVNIWQTKDVYYTSSQYCSRVYNGGWVGDLFIPTRTLSEWNSFQSFRPWGVTINTCCHPNYGQSCTCIYSAQYACNWIRPDWCTVSGQYYVGDAYAGNYDARCVTNNPGTDYSYYNVLCGEYGATIDCAGNCVSPYGGPCGGVVYW